MVRTVAVLVGLAIAAPAMAGEMTAQEARHFVVGKVFSYNCFEGTRGEGRVFANGSVVGSVQFQGSGRMRYAALPAGTLRVDGQKVCASLRGLPFEPCFNLEKTSDDSFVGSIRGLGFASCTFKRSPMHHPRVVHSGLKKEIPLALRPSITADNH
ncbi:MAG TPA: hypothetical protein VE224_16125 [Pseudolabrys sp.]|nr:hypothetical protein [Pseudolabrys sp.]